MRRLLPESRFMRRIAMLSGGTLLGQLVLAGSSPVLTRLYGPAAFGGLAVFMSLWSILVVMAACPYEFAVPVVPDERDAAGLVGVGGVAAAATALATALGVWLGGERLAAATDVPVLAPLLWLLPAIVLCGGVAAPVGAWSIRQGRFRSNTVNTVAPAVGQVGGQLALGLAGAGPAGLVLGYCLGPLISATYFVGALPAAERRVLLAVRWRRLWPLVRRHWQCPVYSTPASLLTIATQMLPAVLLAALYGPAVAGWFGLGQRVMGLPVRLLAQAASVAFLGEAPRLRDDAAVRRLFLRSTAGFAALGLLGMAPVLVLGPWLFAHVFGPAWREAGVMAALLVPQHLNRFVVMPVSQTLNIYGRQDLHLTASVANGAGLALAFGLACAVPMEATTVIGLYSAGTTLAYLLYLGLSWQVVRRGGLSPVAAPEVEVAPLES